MKIIAHFNAFIRHSVSFSFALSLSASAFAATKTVIVLPSESSTKEKAPIDQALNLNMSEHAAAKEDYSTNAAVQHGDTQAESGAAADAANDQEANAIAIKLGDELGSGKANRDNSIYERREISPSTSSLGRELRENHRDFRR